MNSHFYYCTLVQYETVLTIGGLTSERETERETEEIFTESSAKTF